MKASNKLDSKDVSNTALAPLIEHCNKVVGTKAELAQRMSDALGYKVHRQIAEGWVHADPAKRVEPKLGLGLVLLRIGGEMMGLKKPLHLGRTMTKAFKPAGGRKNKPASNGEVAHNGESKPKRTRKPKVAAPDTLSSGEAGRVDSHLGIEPRTRKQRSKSTPEVSPRQRRRSRKLAIS